MYKLPINFLPIIECSAVGYLHSNLLVVLLITALGYFRNNLFLVDILLQCKENLIRVDRLNEVIGNLRTDSLVHYVFLLTLRYHDDRCGRLNLLNTL